MNHAPAIGVQNLHKTYRDGMLGRNRVEALRGVSFQVSTGEIFGLLGPNGAGKTTLIKVLLGIVRHTKGSAWLLGRPPGDREGRRRVGYLPENHRIPRHHTGNTALEYYGSLSGLSVAEVKRRRDRLLAMVGLAEWGRMPVKKYSKGMQQRLGLAQALLHEPELLVLDEPTDGVDPVGRSEMRALLQHLKESGKTIFINSHLLQEIELVCDRVVILDKGQMLREGRIDELTAISAGDITFQLAGAEPEIEAALVGQETGGLVKNDAEQFEVNVRLPDQRAVDECVDALRRRKIGIVSMTRNRQTLEEAFLDIVNRGAPQ
ncbi:MAG TPA: ABC transporter ATP-binding protein [Pirellulales bacterium]|nr:ABC transporter ATP-binding protein [Pirellulales bacterium]